MPDFPITKGTVVRAIGIKDGYLPSDVITESYFINPEGRDSYSLPVISLAIDEDHLFDFQSGIYTAGIDFENWRTINPGTPLIGGGYPANWQRSDEFPLYFQYFDVDDEFSSINQQLGFRIHGGWSRARRIKSIRLYARSSYERPGELNYPFLKDNLTTNGEIVQDYKRLLLRAGGNDNNFLHDALKHRIMSPAQLDLQTVQPTIHFINGEYWGLANIRERIDRFFIASRYGIDPENIIMLNGPWGQGHPRMVQEGKAEDILLFRDYFNFLLSNDIRKEEKYEQVKEFKDVLGYIDYNLMFIYLSNSDWGGWKHYRYWRVREIGIAPHEDGRWRFIIWDFDAPRHPEYDMLAEFLDPQGNGIVWETNFILRKLMENTEFKNLFVNRLADHINTTFQAHRIESLLNELIAEIEPEAEEHLQRWRHPAYPSNEASYFTDFAERRPDIMRDQLRTHLQVGDDIPITLNVSDPEMGFIKINTIKINSKTPGIGNPTYPWHGIYLSAIPIDLEAIPFEGYEFSHWEGLADTISPRQTVSLESALSVTAHFYPTGKPEAEIIYYWVFDNDLPNNTPLSTVTSTYSKGEYAEIFFHSSIAGYPFSSGHPLWREASMERRNQPTTINYFPEYNNGREFGNSNMRGLQIKQPFEGTAGKNQMNIEFSTKGFRNIEVAFAIIDENAVEAVVVNWQKMNNLGFWEPVNFDTDTFFTASSYLLYHKDFSRVEKINDLERVRLNIGFLTDDPLADNGDRLTFNNISVLAYPIDPNQPGILQRNPIPDIHLIANQESQSVNLKHYFEHQGENRIHFETSIDRDKVAEISADREIFTITPTESGGLNVIIKAYDWVSPEVVDTFSIVVHPEAAALKNEEFFFGKWEEDEGFMSYPEKMLFLEHHNYGITPDFEKAYPQMFFPTHSPLPYLLKAENLIRGLGDLGLSILIEGHTQSAVVLALDTRETENLNLTFTTQNLKFGGQMQLYYRTIAGGELTPLITNGNEIIYSPLSFETDEKVHLLQLPAYLEGHEYLQLVWRFEHKGLDYSLEPAEIRLDDIYVFSQKEKEDNTCLNLFPNPVSNQLFFFAPENSSIKIISSSGSLIKELQSVIGIRSVNLTDIPGGVYLFKMENDNSTCVQQFIKH